MARTRGSLDEDHYEKRHALINHMIERLSRTGATKPSLRQLAEAGGVSVPTLRHYFGDRDGILASVFAAWRARGQPFFAIAAKPTGPLSESLNSYLAMLVRANRDLGFARILAVGLIEGLLNRTHGPVFLDHALDPMLDALEQRLEAHQARGEIRPEIDLRFASLSLAGPVLLLCLNQFQLFGAQHNPADVDQLVGHQISMFTRAFAADPNTLS